MGILSKWSASANHMLSRIKTYFYMDMPKYVKNAFS